MPFRKWTERLDCVLVALIALAHACTPFKQRRSEVSITESGAHDADGGAAVESPHAMLGDACDQAGARACTTTEPAAPLLCENESWVRQAACVATEHCQSAPGPDHGTCVAVSADCLAHEDGEAYCAGDELRTCVERVPSTLQACGERRTCRELEGTAQCVCRFGPNTQGDCQTTGSCAVANGGCDPLTACTDDAAGKPVCGKCPAGYSGFGDPGCVPLLSSLTLWNAQLSPMFSADARSYRTTLPLTRQQLEITTAGPSGVRLELNGMPVAASKTWTSPVLPSGQTPIQIALLTDFGVRNEYTLLIDRTVAQSAYLKAMQPDTGDGFGCALALSGDTLVIGACYEDGANGDQANNDLTDSGAAYVFVRKAGVWTQQAYLKSDNPRADDYFGGSAAISGNTLVIGACGASVWGTTAAHGGSVHVFVRQGEQWVPQARLAAPDGDPQDLFGYTVALQRDRLVVGAPFDAASARYSGAVYVFERSGNTWSAPQKLKSTTPNPSDLLGFSIALDEDTVLAGAPQYAPAIPTDTGPGAAVVFVHGGNGWVEQQRLHGSADLEDGSTFGWAVALAGDTTAVGAPRYRGSKLAMSSAGQAYVFARNSGVWESSGVLEATLPRGSDRFGTSLAISNLALLIGASGDTSSARGPSADPSSDEAQRAGAVYVFGHQSDGWARSAYLKSSNVDVGDQFGDRVAIDGETVAASALGEASNARGVDGDQSDNSQASSGAVYVFH